MKSILLILLAFTSSAFAGPTGSRIIAKGTTDRQIYIECLEVESCEAGVLVLKDHGETIRFTDHPFELNSNTDAYQNRWGLFTTVYTQATLLMPMFPEFRYLYLIETSKRAYLDAFRKLDDPKKPNQTIAIKTLYFDKLAQAMREILH